MQLRRSSRRTVQRANENRTQAKRERKWEIEIVRCFNDLVGVDAGDFTYHQIPQLPVNPSSEAGGFIVDDVDQAGEEGFGHTRPDVIPLSLIPKALEELNLDPDDSEVLEIFKNSALGWENLEREKMSEHSKLDSEFVQLKDFKEVMMILLAARDGGQAYTDSDLESTTESLNEGNLRISSEDDDGNENRHDFDSNASDAQSSWSDPESDNSNVESRSFGTSSDKAGRLRRKSHKSSSNDGKVSVTIKQNKSSRKQKLTSDQLHQASLLFKLFTDGKYLTAKDILRVSEKVEGDTGKVLLKSEILEMFCFQPDGYERYDQQEFAEVLQRAKII